MKRLYIDFDGVVMDTIPPLYDALQKSGADVTNESEIRVFFASYDFSKIINDDKALQDARVYLTYSVGRILKTGAALLGIEMPDKM